MMFRTAKLDYHLIITNAGYFGGKKTVHQKKGWLTLTGKNDPAQD